MSIDLENHFYDKYVTSTFDIIYSLSKALDLVNPLINDHHQRVAFIAGSIAKEAGYSEDEIEDIILASLVHDIGVVVEKEFHELVNDEEQYECELSHVLVGSFLMKDLHFFPNIPKLIKYHHTPYRIEKNLIDENEEVPETSNIIHLADRIDIALKRDVPALDQREKVTDKIKNYSPNKFNPAHVEAFLRLADREHFWFEIEEHDKYPLIKYNFHFSHIDMTMDDALEMSRLLSRIIDFRCIFTSTHSAGVATVAYTVAELMGMSPDECKAAKIAGYLHDIGKLAIPSYILYKTDKLTPEESLILKKHPYYTYRILNSFQIFETIIDWASYHHEKLNGKGYPFHLHEDKLSKGCRILAVADIFTALSEERPYRKSESKENLTALLKKLAEQNELDHDVINTFIDNFDIISQKRQKAQNKASEEFSMFCKNVFSNNVCKSNITYVSVLTAD